MRLRRYIHPVVTWGDWGVSCRTGDSIDGAILSIHRSRIRGKNLPINKWLCGNGDGRLFPSIEAAWQWAFDHGYLQLYFTHADLRARRKQYAAERKAALIEALLISDQTETR